MAVARRAEIVWTVEPDGRRRRRYRPRIGRGHPSRALLDGGDLRLAMRELEEARAYLLAAYELPVVDRNGRIVRREAIHAALAKLALASRMIDEVVIRRGGIAGDCAA